ncbi:AN1-type zinc finger protein [uncultured Methanoregula sp.]|uniref:AN1-type zinc finger protein n=1 Tax=uncultured Methanoregula sp. TaxID=1005933 RepID=UPI002AAAEE7A|nr:AN1-type zinc finger protein [uncultured Methanoregula sp.]
MAACENCGTECALPFTCQHCGGVFCPDCRLPPNHNCAGIGRWNRKPRPSVNVNYGKGGGVTVIGGGHLPDGRRDTKKKSQEGISYLKIMLVVIILILAGLALLVMTGYPIR